jgi:WD40 repeat protein
VRMVASADGFTTVALCAMRAVLIVWNARLADASIAPGSAGDASRAARVFTPCWEVRDASNFGPPADCDITPDGRTLIAVYCGANTGSGNTAVRYDLIARSATSVYRFIGDGTRSVCAISADASVIAVSVTVHGLGSIHAIDARTSAVVSVLSFSTPVTDLAMDAAGAHLVVAAEGRLSLWRVQGGGAKLHELHGFDTFSASRSAFSSDGRVVIAHASKTAFGVWDARTGALVAFLEGHAGMSYSCAMDAKGALGVSTGADGTIRMWNLSTVSDTRTEAVAHSDMPARTTAGILERPDEAGNEPDLPQVSPVVALPPSSPPRSIPPAPRQAPKFPMTYPSSSLVLPMHPPLQSSSSPVTRPPPRVGAETPAGSATSSPFANVRTERSDGPVISSDQEGVRAERSTDDRECVICMGAAVNCAMTPCGHASYCLPCGKTLLVSGQPCAICRQQVHSVQQIFF